MVKCSPGTRGLEPHKARALEGRAGLVFAAAFAAVLGTASAARANGRFPESNQILFSAEDPNLVILRVTFGLLVSHDRGKTFQWVCESAIQYSGVEDPMYALTPSQAIVGTTFQGLTISRDNACSWKFAGGDLASQVFTDLSSSPIDRKDIVVFSSAYDKQDDAGNILFASKIWETKDEANNFTKVATLDPTLLGYTIDLTKTDPNRMYVTAVRDPGTAPKAVLLASNDHGQTWREEPVPLVGTERALYIAAVDPTNAERVYLRTSAGTDKPTRIILREGVDGGPGTQRTIHTANAAILGFALSPDAAKVYIGGPKDGLLVASTQDFAFKQRLTFDDAGAPSVEVQCLGLNQDGLWACSNERSGFIAAVSKDDGVTFEPGVHFCDISGPLASCGPGTSTNDQCVSVWPLQKSLLGCSAPGPDGGDGGAEGGSSGGAGGSNHKNCDCHASPAGPWGALVTAMGAAIALVRRARRRSR